MLKIIPFFLLLPNNFGLLLEQLPTLRKSSITTRHYMKSGPISLADDDNSVTSISTPIPSSSRIIFANLHSSNTDQIHHREWSDYSNAASLEKASMHVQPMLSLAYAEFKDWIERTIARNVYGNSFEFDRRQWQTSIGKWWARALEADEYARIEFARQYIRILDSERKRSRGYEMDVLDLDTQEDWDAIYFDCEPQSANSSRSEKFLEKSRLATIPVHVDEVVDCAVHGRWHVKYEESGAQIADYQPW